MAYLGNQPVVGDSANTFKLLDDISTFTLTFDGSSASVVSVANNTLTFANHRFVTGQRVTYGKGGGTVITGLTDATAYFIIKVDQSTIKLATNASNAASSTAIDLTGLGAGTSHTLNVAFDGVNTKFKATHTDGTKANVSRAAQLSLSINGVIQQPTETKPPTVGYGIEADSTIVFSTAPVSTDKAFGSFIGEAAPSFDLTDNTVDNFTGDGSTTSFTLSKEVPSSQDVLVTLDGVTQYPSDASTTRAYSVIGQTLTFVSAPDDGVAIQARHIGFAGATTSEVTGFYGRTGNVALKSTDDITFQNASAGIITATTFGGNPSFTGSVSIGGTLTYEDVTNIDSVGLITARNGIVVGSGITLSKDGDIFATGVSTFQSTKVTSLDVTAGLGIAESLFHLGDTNTRFAFPADDTISFDTAGSERFRIEAGGAIGIGTTNPTTYKLHLQGSTSALARFERTGGDFAKVDIKAGSSSGNSYLTFSDPDASEVGEINYEHADNSLRFNTNSSERLRINSSGGVHIATTSGNEKLNVNGAVRVSGSSADFNAGLEGALVDYDTSNNIARFGHVNGASGSARSVTFLSGGSEKVRITSDGDLLLGTTSNGGGNRMYVVDSHTETFVNPSDTILRIENADTSGTTGQASISFTTKTTGSNADSAIVSQAEDASGNSRLEFWTDTSNGMSEKMAITAAGYMSRPLHPNFCARMSASQNTSAQDVVIYDNVSSNYRRWNIGGHYSTTTGKFTAPIDGIYYFEGQVMTTGWSNNDNIQDLIFLNSSQGNVSYPRQRRSYFRTEDDANGYFTNSCAGQVQLSSGDTVWVQIQKACTVTSQQFCYFTGWLVQ